MQVTTAQTATPTPGADVIVVTNADGTQIRLPIPVSRAQLSALRSQRSELSNQLINVAERRHELSEELKTAPAGPSRTGLEERIAVLDKRIIQIESDIAATGRQVSAAPLEISSQGMAGDPADVPENVAIISVSFIGLILFPLAMVLARNLWKRGSIKKTAPLQLAGDAGQRLERLEQGMDAIAIEIERVAEGQRFVTRLLSEGHAGESVSINRSMERSSTS